MTVDDQATMQEELMREMALKVRKHELPKIGQCYNCGEKVKASANFCDVDCRLDYERRIENAKGK